MTPVNWKAGNDILIPLPPKADGNNTAAAPEGFYSPVWYLMYKKAAK
jgi:hypothetical protein